MKKYLYLLAGLAAGFVLVFMGTAICQYLHLTQSGYVRYDDSVEVVYQQVAEYAGVDPATLSIHAKRGQHDAAAAGQLRRTHLPLPGGRSAGPDG